MGGTAGFIYLAEGNSWLRETLRPSQLPRALVKWNHLCQEKLQKMPQRRFVSLATRFQQLLDEGNHHHRLLWAQLCEIQASLWVPAVKWFSLEHELGFKHCCCSGSLKCWWWSKIMDEGGAGGILGWAVIVRIYIPCCNSLLCQSGGCTFPAWPFPHSSVHEQNPDTPTPFSPAWSSHPAPLHRPFQYISNSSCKHALPSPSLASY